MTRPGIEPRSPGSLENTLLIRPMAQYYLTHSWEDKGIHTFPKGNCLKVNIIARLEFELTTILQSSALTITSQGQPCGKINLANDNTIVGVTSKYFITNQHC